MSLESFVGSEEGEGMSAAALEKLREKMKRASQQIKAIKKEEKKQKKKEDELLRILLRFVKHSHKRDLVLLISRVLEQNVPANFVLALILLGNEEVQQAVGHFLMLGKGSGKDGETQEEKDKALIFFDEDDESMPLKLKIEVDAWIKNTLSQAQESPQKLIKTSYDKKMVEIETESQFDDPQYREEKEVKGVIIQLATYVLRQFLEANKESQSYEKLHSFCEFIITGILKKVEEELDNRQLLTD
jgi:hypothetical protein